MKAAFALLALLVVLSGCFANESSAEISENQAFLLEGSGFAVTEEIIRISEVDLGLSSQNQRGSTIDFLIEDGFIILGEEEFVISNLQGKFLREGKYVRINGEIESSSGFDTSVSLFGRLVDESKNASVYGFTGRITTSDDTYKIIYTTKLSPLSKIDTIATGSKTPVGTAIHILLYSSAQKTADDLTPGVNSSINLRFFSQDRISVEPGASITIVNDDVASHSILSGKENADRYAQYSADGRISTGEILPGKSATITFNDPGFYRLYDPDYQWMNIVAYVFPASDSLIFGNTGSNQQGN